MNWLCERAGPETDSTRERKLGGEEKAREENFQTLTLSGMAAAQKVWRCKVKAATQMCEE